MNELIIKYSSDFDKEFRKLPLQVKNKFYKKEKIFREDQFSSTLKTHKLSGAMEGLFAFSIDFHYRVTFARMSSFEILFVDVGTHEIYG